MNEYTVLIRVWKDNEIIGSENIYCTSFSTLCSYPVYNGDTGLVENIPLKSVKAYFQQGSQIIELHFGQEQPGLFSDV